MEKWANEVNGCMEKVLLDIVLSEGEDHEIVVSFADEERFQLSNRKPQTEKSNRNR